MRNFTKIKFKMNKSLAVLAIAALATVPTEAVKTEFMNFFDKPLWGSATSWMTSPSGNTMSGSSSSATTSQKEPVSPAMPSSWFKNSHAKGQGGYFENYSNDMSGSMSGDSSTNPHPHNNDPKYAGGFARAPGATILDTNTLNPTNSSPFTRSKRSDSKTPNPYNQPYTPYSNAFVNMAVPGNTRAIEKAFDCCLEHRDLIKGLRGRLVALREKAAANKLEIVTLGTRIDAAEVGVENLDSKVENNETGIGSL